MRILAALVLLLSFALPVQADQILSAEMARDRALKGEIVLVDIRTPGEWAETGLPDVAHAIDLQSQDFGPKLKALMDANAGKPIAMICATGGRSSYVTQALAKHGITILNVREGMMGSADGPGWRKKGLPVRAPDQPRVE